MKDVPFSGYCKVCWQAVYVLWVDKEPHDGACIEGCSRSQDCRQAMSWERFKGRLRKATVDQQ